ncbi:16235_t:CDS:2 [Rhizophagus irregularis]|nr:16235_t:CDS:2 [Rhizophagus irregularis]
MPMIDKYFERKYTKWNIIDFLNECDIETFEGKIDHYLKSLRAIVDYEEGANQDKASGVTGDLFGSCHSSSSLSHKTSVRAHMTSSDDRPGPDYKDARNWEKRTSVRAGSSFHFHNSTITGNSLGGNSGVINNVKFPKERNRAALSMTYTTGQPILFVGTGQTYTDLKNMRVGHTEMESIKGVKNIVLHGITHGDTENIFSNVLHSNIKLADTILYILTKALMGRCMPCTTMPILDTISCSRLANIELERHGE